MGLGLDLIQAMPNPNFQTLTSGWHSINATIFFWEPLRGCQERAEGPHGLTGVASGIGEVYSGALAR